MSGATVGASKVGGISLSLWLDDDDGFHCEGFAAGRTSEAPGLTAHDAYAHALRPLVPFLEGAERTLAESMLADFEAGSIWRGLP